MVFNWGLTQELYPAKHKWLKLSEDESAPILVESSFSLVGEIRHRGFPWSQEEKAQ